MDTIPPISSTPNPTTTPTPMAQSKKTKPKKPTAKPKKLDESNVKTPNHTWTTDQKMTLLESIATQYAAGLETDNGGLKKEAWPIVQEKLNTNGFGWNDKRGTVTANESVWEELIAAHPRRNFARLKDKPFPVYDLAYSVFTGKAATGEIANSELVPTTTEAVKLTPAAKRKIVPLSDDDSSSDIDIEPKSSLKTAGSNTTKRVRKSKNALIKSEMESISGAINAVSENSKNLMGEFAKIASAVSSNQPPHQPSTSAIAHGKTQSTISDTALQVCADRYLNKVLDKTYVDFASVVVAHLVDS
ncbi:hypothetical protein PTTG_26564 [Puccinia triticina 1-1 BBBD Race 1]|uniref:Myb/SANT-like domain-containing protein n=1 Tax=Puccinia triticina (isolate 1-1 / race 1 (BBBD)) TaxID=630390 RepID=A0A180GSC8_PUCT1|nr:hypothetical protein PTTG_26564 [Puccinia triticina 1-1 BBBD Race 1]